MKVQNVILRLLKERGISKRQFARAVKGVHESHIYDILRGRTKRPRIDTLEKIAKALGLPATHFWRSEDPEHVQTLDPVQLGGRIHGGAPRISEQQSAEYLLGPAAEVAKGNLYALHVHGDSMKEAGIVDGDYIFYRRQPTAPNGAIVVAWVNDEVSVKRLYRYDDQIILNAANPEYQPIIVSPADKFRIDGIVTHVIRKLQQPEGD